MDNKWEKKLEKLRREAWATPDKTDWRNLRGAEDLLPKDIEKQTTAYQELAAEFDTVAAGHTPKRPTEWLEKLPGKRSLRAIEWWRAEGVEWSQSLGTADWWEAQAARLRARAVELHKLEHPQGSYRQPTEEERAAAEERDAALEKSVRLEQRRHTRYGKPDERFGELQQITGEEKVWRIYVRPGASTSKANPHWLKEAEPGALCYDVFAASRKNARHLVHLGLRAKGPNQRGIRSETTISDGASKAGKKAGRKKT